MRHQIKLIICAIVVLASLNIVNTLGLNTVGMIGSGTDSVKGTLSVSSSSNENTWEDSQWQFFKTTCSLGETINVSLDFSGTLVCDLLLFVDNTTTGNQKYAWDITHCQLDLQKYPPTAYSSIATTETNVTGPENVVYNNIVASSKTVYILVLARYGTGNTTYILNSTEALVALNNNDLDFCWNIVEAWIIFGVVCVIIFFIFVYWIRISTLTKEQKAKIILQKQQKKLEKENPAKKTTTKKDGKLKVSDKQVKSSMAARKAASHR